MAYSNDLAISKLVEILAEKTLQTSNAADFDNLSTDEIESACTLLPKILVALRRAANLRTPVNRLPPEILLRIFAFIPQATQFTAFDTVWSVCGPFKARNVWELRPITQVCYKWRSLSLSVSSLWSTCFRKPHSVSRSGAIPENSYYLSRCISGPIQVFVEEDGILLSKWERLSTLVDAPQDYEDRVEELHVLTVDGWRHGFMPPSLLSPRMGALQRLVVHSLYSRIMEASGWQWHGLQQVFMGQTLRLRSLAIIDSPFLPSNIAPVLTHLVLFYDMKREMHDTWSLHDLLHFLSATPTLEDIVICGIPIGIGKMQRQPMPTAHLNNLRKLSIRTLNYQNSRTLGTPFPLLSHLIIPQSCYLRLDGTNAISALAAHFRGRQWNVPASNVHCVWGASPYVMSSLQATFPAPGGGIRADFQTPHDADTHLRMELAPALHALLETTPFAAAKALWVSGSGIDDDCDTRLAESLSVLVDVKSLYIVNDHLHEPYRFVELLGMPMLAASSPPRLSFPKLETLYVTVYDRLGIEKLAEMLHRRADWGCRLSHLLVGCTEVGDDDEGATPGPVVGEIEAELCLAVRGAVGKVTVLDKDGYRKDYALRTVLPPLCMLPGGGLIWPPWTENETTFSLMHLT